MDYKLLDSNINRDLLSFYFLHKNLLFVVVKYYKE
nr:MAG TPA: hypothetical protein [Caudoviricetes sp.]